jgi:phosphoglycerol transferase
MTAMIPSRLASTLALGAILAALAACSDEPDAKRAPAPAASGTAKPAAATPMGSSYEATLAEGIDFTKPGYPRFVKEVQGMSGEEPWGRWTDANLAPTARFRFDKPLPKAFTLELRATGLGPNAYQPVKIRAGSVEREVTLGNPAKESYRVAFAGVEGDTLEIVPPAPILPREVTPQSTDTRRLGVGLTTLRIVE